MRFAFTAVIAAACFAVPCAFAAAPSPAPSVKDGGDLGKLMGQMGGHFKALKKDAADASKKESNAAHFKAIAELAEKCKALPPASVKTAADKKTYADELDQTVAGAKAGVKTSAAGDAAATKKVIEGLMKVMKAGHGNFKKD